MAFLPILPLGALLLEFTIGVSLGPCGGLANLLEEDRKGPDDQSQPLEWE